MSAPQPLTHGSPRRARTWIVLGAAALLLVGALPRGARGEDPPDAPPAAPPEAAPRDPAQAKAEHEQDHKRFVARVNAAIDRGQAYLLSSQGPDGRWTPRQPNTIVVDGYGEQALVLLALAKTGIKANHRAMQTGLDELGRLFNERKGTVRIQGVEVGHRTYAAACWCLLLDALYVEHPEAGPAARPGAPAQKPKGRPPPDARATLEDVVEFLIRTQREGLWRYPGPTLSDRDLSATQYALMALLTAGRLGIHAEAAVYRKALKEVLAWQSETGPDVAVWTENPAWDPSDRYPRFVKSGTTQARGWPYQPKGTVTGSMTCAGVAALAILKDRLSDERLPAAQALTREERGQIDRALLSGLAWLDQHFSVEANPGSGATWHYYYLYGLERACSLLGVRFLGQHDWYREGADYLVQQQAADGSWAGSAKGERLDLQTAFALLFLKRATVPTRFSAPAITGG